MDAPETSSAATNKSHRNQQQHQNRPRRVFPSKSHSLQKRPVSKPFARKGDIYVSNKSNFQAQMKQCQELLESEETGEIFLHCLGNAIKRGVTLALKLVQESDNRLGYEANTSTIDLIVLAVRLGGHVPEETLDWFTVFSPLFCGDICNSYFSIIVGIRMYLDNDNKRKALQRLLWSVKVLVLTGVFKYLLCLKLSGAQNLEYSEVFAPIFVLLQLIAVRACQLSSSS